VNIVPSFLKGSRVRGPVVFCANLISWSGFQLERNSTTRQCVCFFESDIETLSSVESTVADYHKNFDLGTPLPNESLKLFEPFIWGVLPREMNQYQRH